MNARPEPALDEARRSGVSPADVEQLCDVWKREHPRWGIGALYRRIQCARPGQPADDLATWPRPSKEFEDMQRRQAQRAVQIARQAQFEEERDQAAAAERQAAELEESFGPVLDQMSAADLEAFAAEQLAGNPFLEKFWRTKGLASGIVREHLIAALAEAEAAR